MLSSSKTKKKTTNLSEIENRVCKRIQENPGTRLNRCFRSFHEKIWMHAWQRVTVVNKNKCI